jgi:8-oxo-dGTP diphosphatase
MAEAMAIHLVRHAKAGSRSDWAQPDELRPLTPAGMVQAAAICALLRDRPVKRVLSSPYVRCVQTVEPLADALGLELEHHHALGEDTDPNHTWELLAELAGTEAVLCSHGNVIPDAVDRAVRSGAEVLGRMTGNRKGSVWTLETDEHGVVKTVRYTPPPA